MVASGHALCQRARQALKVVREQSVGRIALSEDRIFPLKRQHVPAFPEVERKAWGLKPSLFFAGLIRFTTRPS